MKTLQEKATFAAQFFTAKTRDNGNRFICLKDEAPEWLTDMCQLAHNGMFPDDDKYRFIDSAVSMLSQYEDAEDAFGDITSDVYNSDLLEWVASHGQRTSYVDEYVNSYGYSDLIAALTGGQHLEREEVFSSVRSFLENLDDSEFEDESIAESAEA